ncbi:MAG: tetratricopeptide repeat protein, partial [Pirellulaceae bacterium]|nr:tetratricopeptide repeat protein [Pirellulaceae bacterium]
MANQFWHRGPSVSGLIEQGRDKLNRREFPAALELAEQALRRSPDSNEALLLAGHTAAAMGEFSDCLAYLERVPDDGSSPAANARCFAGDVLLLHFKRLSAAESQFRRALRQDPENLSAHDHLAFTLGVGARPWEQIQHRLLLIQYDRFEPAHLKSLSLGDYAIENDDLAEEYHRSDDADAAPRLMLA